MRYIIILLILIGVTTDARGELFIYTNELPDLQVKKPTFSVKNREFTSFIYKEVPEYSAGRNLRLVDVLPHLTPSNDWLVRVDESAENMKVTWRGGLHWFEILEAIDIQTNANILISHDSKVVAVSKQEELLPFLANREPMVWRLKKELSLKGNVMRWLQTIGWDLDWRLDKDFPVTHSAVFTGPLVDEKDKLGQLSYVIDQINETTSSDLLLGYQFKKGNNVFVVYEKPRTISKNSKVRGF